MILRSISPHVKDQNWFAVFLDFVMVVAGILIALQIANWNEERIDRQRAAVFMNRLETDFIAILERLDTNLLRFDVSIKNIAYVRQVLSANPELSNDESEAFRAALNIIDSTSVPGSRAATFVEMQSSGELNLIVDAHLKKSLLTYDHGTEIAHKGGEQLQAQMTAFISPILFRHIEYAPDAGASPNPKWFDVQNFDYERMRNEPDFKSALSALSMVQSNFRSLQANQRDLAADVLRQLSKRTVQ